MSSSVRVDVVADRGSMFLFCMCCIPFTWYLRYTRLIVWQPRRAADTSTNWRQSLSVAAPRAWNRLPTELKLLRSTDLFRRDLKSISVSFCLRAPGYGLTP